MDFIITESAAYNRTMLAFSKAFFSVVSMIFPEILYVTCADAWVKHIAKKAMSMHFSLKSVLAINVEYLDESS
jgi:hypothetical protein